MSKRKGADIDVSHLFVLMLVPSTNIRNSGRGAGFGENEFALRHDKLRMLTGHQCKGPADHWKGNYNQRHGF